MKTIIFYLLMLFAMNCITDMAQKKEENNNFGEKDISFFLDWHYKNNILLYDKPAGKIIKKLKHNFKDGDYIVFKLLSQNDTMFFVNSYFCMEGFIAKGWIKKSNHIGIYSRAYNKSLILYKGASIDSGINCIIEEYNPKMYIVTDFEGDWLKVKTTLNGVFYEGWMSPDMQCPNMYTTCS